MIKSQVMFKTPLNSIKASVGASCGDVNEITKKAESAAFQYGEALAPLNLSKLRALRLPGIPPAVGRFRPERHRSSRSLWSHEEHVSPKSPVL